MKYKKTFAFLAAAMLGSQPIMSQTTLSVGDLSFLFAESDANGAVADGYGIVTWSELAAGTVLKFTDIGMSNAAGTSATSSEHAWTFTVGSSAIAAGTTLTFGYDSPTTGKWNGPSSGTTSANSPSNPGISTSGDQLFVYQGTGTGSNISAGTFSGTLVAGINFGNVQTSGETNSNSSYSPTSLVNGSAYVSVGNVDNTYYNGVRTGLTNTLYRAALSNSTNFGTSNTLTASYDRTTSFTISSTAAVHWDANGSTANDGGSGTWDTTTQSLFKNGAAGTTFLRWVNSSSGNDHTAVFGGTAGTVTVSGGVTASGLIFDTTGYTIESSTVTLAGTAPTISVSTGIATISSEIAGTNGLTKSESGSLVLSGSNSYTGATSINAGSLIVNGSTSTSSAFTVASGGTLGGTGTIGGNVSVLSGGTHAPGNSPGTQIITGDLNYAAGSVFAWEIDTAASSFDKVQVSGALTGTSSTFNISSTTAFTDAFWDTMQSWNNIFSADGTSETAKNFASIFSSFSGTGLTPSGMNAEGSFSFTNSTTLTWTPVPEASNLLIGGLVGLGLLSRRRKNA